MPISVNPSIPVLAAQPLQPDLVLQPGTVVDAQVLKLLAENLVRIAIAGFSIDVLSEVPLVAGQSLQLAVSQTQEGVRLAVVGPGGASGAAADTVSLAPAAAPDVPANAAVFAVPPKNQLTPLERVAVAAAVQSAAAQQQSLAPLFANLDAAAVSHALPPKLQQAVIQVLAQRTSLDQNLAGSDVKNAVQKSGLFLEASLASGSVEPAAGVPDLKAALIVLRQTLASALATAAGPVAPSATAEPQPVTQAASVVPAIPAAPAGSPANAAAPHLPALPQVATLVPLAPSLPEPEMVEILLPQARLPVADDSLESASPIRIVLPESLLNAGPRTMTPGIVLNLLQETLQGRPQVVGTSSSFGRGNAAGRT